MNRAEATDKIKARMESLLTSDQEIRDITRTYAVDHYPDTINQEMIPLGVFYNDLRTALIGRAMLSTVADLMQTEELDFPEEEA